MQAVKPSVRSNLHRGLLLGLEILLVLTILALLLATWMPALVGARPGSTR